MKNREQKERRAAVSALILRPQGPETLLFPWFWRPGRRLLRSLESLLSRAETGSTDELIVKILLLFR